MCEVGLAENYSWRHQYRLTQTTTDTVTWIIKDISQLNPSGVSSEKKSHTFHGTEIITSEEILFKRNRLKRHLERKV